MCFSYLQYSRGLSFLLLADQQLFYTKMVLHGGEGVMNDKMMIQLGLASINYSLLKQRVCPKHGGCTNDIISPTV